MRVRKEREEEENEKQEVEWLSKERIREKSEKKQ